MIKNMELARVLSTPPRDGVTQSLFLWLYFLGTASRRLRDRRLRLSRERRLMREA